jgi:uncharacterized protein YjeT (DUF2065 family)
MESGPMMLSERMVAMFSAWPYRPDAEAPAALVMGAAFLLLGLSMILQPANIRETFDRLGETLVESVNRISWRQQSWHPSDMSDRGLRLAGVIVIVVATLFFYIAYLGLAR